MEDLSKMTPAERDAWMEEQHRKYNPLAVKVRRKPGRKPRPKHNLADVQRLMEKDPGKMTAVELFRLSEARYWLEQRRPGRRPKPGGANERVVFYVPPVTARALEELATRRNTTVAKLLTKLAAVATKT